MGLAGVGSFLAMRWTTCVPLKFAESLGVSETRMRDTDRDSDVEAPATRDSSDAVAGGMAMIASRWIGLVGALVLGILGAEAALGSERHPGFSIGRLEAQAELLSDETARVFRDSRLLTPMLRHLHNVGDAAAELRFLARTDASVPRMRAQLFRMEADTQALLSLMRTAEGRARRGIDPPTCGCAVTLRRRVEAFREGVVVLRESLDDRHGGHRGGWGGNDRCPPEPRWDDFGDDWDAGFEPWGEPSRGGSGVVIRGRNFSIGFGDQGTRGGSEGPSLRLW